MDTNNKSMIKQLINIYFNFIKETYSKASAELDFIININTEISRAYILDNGGPRIEPCGTPAILFISTKNDTAYSKLVVT